MPSCLRGCARGPGCPQTPSYPCLHASPPTYSTTWINFLLSFPSKITPSLPTSQHATLIQDVSLGLTYCSFFFSSLLQLMQLVLFSEGDALDDYLIISMSIPILSIVFFFLDKKVPTSALSLLACSPNPTLFLSMADWLPS